MSKSIDKQTVQKLVAHQQRLKITDAVFARRYLKRSASTWSLIRSDSYPSREGGIGGVLESALATLADEAHILTTEPSIVEIQPLQDLLDAVKLTTVERDNRLVVFLARTGGGKSTSARLLKRLYGQNAIMVTARLAWRDSRLAVYGDILAALDDDTEYKSANKAETALFKRLKKEPCVIIIDKAHYFGAQTLNVVEALCSDTADHDHKGCRCVLLAIPTLWTNLTTKAYEEAQQVQRRRVIGGVIQVDKVTADDVTRMTAQLLPKFGTLNGDKKSAITSIAAAANRFGLYDTVARVCNEAAAEAAETKSLTLDHITAAIERVETSL